MSEQMTLRGTLQGHGGWVTQIATTPQFPDMLLSASRGMYLARYTLTREHNINFVKLLKYWSKIS